MTPKPDLPHLPLENWEETKLTFHLYLQVVGKIRLKLTPRRNHWWHVTLYVSPRGITTFSIPYGSETFEMNFDLIDHTFEVKTSKGEHEILSLHDGLSVAEFYRWVFATFKKLGIEVQIVDKPYDLPVKDKPFEALDEHHAYNKEYVHRFWRILLWVDQVFKEFSARFYGKTCPVHIYWHHMDLTVTRFSGKEAPKMPAEASNVEKDAYSHEVISFGFWAGDQQVREPAFYSYTYPAPDGINKEELLPASAQWIDSNGSPMAFLTYEDILKEEDPRQALLSFMQSAYEAGAKSAGWDMEKFRVKSFKEM